MSLPEAQKRAKRCCFTGHRPEKLGIPEKIIYEKLSDAIDLARSRGIVTFICGMAQGFDLWAGSAVLQKKEIDPEIKLICATPFTGFENRWNSHWKELYAHIASHGDYKVAISRSYNPGCFQRRNEWMVNHSGLVIAAYNGEPGGTKNTILYAERCGVPVHNILDFSMEFHGF